MKTAIQAEIERLEIELYRLQTVSWCDRYEQIEVQLSVLRPLLTAERAQIESAWYEGDLNFLREDDKFKNASDYYDKTYGNG